MPHLSVGLPIDRLFCGDAVELSRERITNKSINAIVTDFPYNINKAEWDKKEGYIDWLMEVFKECERTLKDNGTLWFFHIEFTILAELHMRIVKETNLRHKQFIIINKGLPSVANRSNKTLRSYPRATEYLQFYTFDDPTGAQQLSEQYARINPMAKYLKEEFGRAEVTNAEIAELFPSKTGGLTGCVFNWLNGFNFPLKEQYLKIREYLNRKYQHEDLRREYDYLRREYEDLRREYDYLRYTFNLQYRCTDVWDINFYNEKKLHICQKPLKLMERIILTATNEGDIVLDPFVGSGTTCIAARRLNRHYIGFDNNPDYIEIAKRRLAAIPRPLEVYA